MVRNQQGLPNRTSVDTQSSNVMTIRRQGQFVVGQTKKNENQCGPRGTNILHYSVAIVSKANRLNAKGFIIDNTDIQTYFDDTYKLVDSFESCEQIAEDACEDFRTMFGANSDNAIEVYGICVVISGVPGRAELECQWLRPGYEENLRVIAGMRPSMSI